MLLSVRDNGSGIAKEKLDAIFRPFVQDEWMLSSSEGGLGLGLSVVRMLTEVHGGRMEAYSDGPHQGRRFSVYLQPPGGRGSN